MSQSDIYIVLCVVLGEDVAFSVEIVKNGIVGQLKDLIKEKRSDVFAGIAVNFLDLYHVDIPDADKKDLMASVEACPLNSPLRPSTRLIKIFPDTPKDDTVHFLVKPSRKRPASTQLTNEVKRRMTVQGLPTLPPSAATEQNVLDKFGDRIEHNRPKAKYQTIPIALLHEVFGTFLEDCQKHVPTQPDNLCLFDLRNAMLQDYSNEAKRTSSFRAVFEKHEMELKCAKIPKSSFLTDGDVRLDDHLLLLTEGKNEWNNLSADPALQAFMYYLESLKSGPHGCKCARLPCLIIYYASSFIGFAGAIFADKPMLEPLTPLFPFHVNAHDTNASMPLARSLGALKKAFESLQEYYKLFETAEPNDPRVITNTEFPYRAYYTSVEGGMVRFHYQSRIYAEKLVFLCRTEKGGKDLCVKFTQRYSKDAHQFCATNGVAPELYAVERLPGGWLMVVMEYLATDAFELLAVSSKSARSRFKADVTAAVDVLHRGGFVHGDIRDVNTMVNCDWNEADGMKNIKLVDFDWAGPVEKTVYPPNVNRRDIDRPMNAKDGMPITKDHDLEMVVDMFRQETA